MAKAKTERVKTIATENSARTPRPSWPERATEQDIARRAYELYTSRGCEAGHDIDDWLQAERELNIDAEC